jgi:hypothetical protein
MVERNSKQRRGCSDWRPLASVAIVLAVIASIVTMPAWLPLPASPASVASAQQPGPTTTTPSPTVAPPATPDPISKAKAVLVAPKTFRVGGNTTLDASGSVGDRVEWKITDSRFLMIGDGRKQAITFTDPDAPNAADPFAVTLLVFTVDSATKAITSVDSDVAIVRLAGPPVVQPAPPGPAPVDPSEPGTPTVPVVDPTTKATAAYYFFEKDDGAVPPPVQTALDRLMREKKIDARSIEQDVTDGTDRMPEAFKAPFAAAKQAGLPSLVVLAGAEILSVTKSPQTEAAILAEVP